MQSIHIQKRTPSLPVSLTEYLPYRLPSAVEQLELPWVEELRMHGERETFVTCKGKSYSTGVILSSDEVSEILRRMCRGSLYAFSQSIHQGFLMLSEGIRVGVAGKAAVENGQIIGVNDVNGLVARIPHKLSVSASFLLEELKKHAFLKGVLLFAPPGVGKTTLLRALALEASSPPHSLRTVVVDTREEFYHTLLKKSCNLELLVSYPKEIGIEIATRSLGAQLILCDEIGNPFEAEAILSAANCGVPVIASAHAASLLELLSRPMMHRLHRARVFESYVGITRGAAGAFSYQIASWEDAQWLFQ